MRKLPADIRLESQTAFICSVCGCASVFTYSSKMKKMQKKVTFTVIV